MKYYGILLKIVYEHALETYRTAMRGCGILHNFWPPRKFRGFHSSHFTFRRYRSNNGIAHLSANHWSSKIQLFSRLLNCSVAKLSSFMYSNYYNYYWSIKSVEFVRTHLIILYDVEVVSFLRCSAAIKMLM